MTDVDPIVYTPDPAAEPQPDPSGKHAGPIRLALRRLVRRPSAMVALAWLLLMGFVGAFADQIASYDPTELIGKPFEKPSWQHPFGLDELGRDVFSRILHGAGLSMLFSLIVVGLALLIAVPLGLVAGYLGGRVDNALMRLVDAMLSFPALILSIAIIAVLGPSLEHAGVAVAIATIPGLTRLVRGQVLAVREETFIEASRSIGSPDRSIIARHLFPNVLSPLVVQASILLGVVLLVEAALSFLGLGAQPPAASWGSMLQRAQQQILVHPWQILAPGAAIVLTVLAFNIFGDGLRASLTVGEPVRRHGRLGLTTVARAEKAAAGDPVATDLATAASASAAMNGTQPLLRVAGLGLEFATPTSAVRVVDDVSFSIMPGETLGLVGESGAGKTVTALSIMRLLPSPPARIVSGSVVFDGRDLLASSFDDMRKLRGGDLSMIFQDPTASLNPGRTIRSQIAQMVRWHEPVSKDEAQRRVLEALDHVGISARRANSYPHEFSGGMRQRAMIAMALVNRPKLLIADEPTTALDVTMQAQVLELLKRLRDELGMALLFVTHDFGVVADVCDRVVVMYAGQVVETGRVRDIFYDARHPYTEGLIASMPQAAEPRAELRTIPGQVPAFSELGDGCRLADRCPYVEDRCRTRSIQLTGLGELRSARCVRVEEPRVEFAERRE